MLPASHAHPLSPPLESELRTSILPDAALDLPDASVASHASSVASSSRPLFPPSPEGDADQDEDPIARRGSSATSPGDTDRPSRPIGLGLPTEVLERSRGEPRDFAPSWTPVPRRLSLPRPPHDVPAPTLALLPLSHLVALARTLSRDLELAQQDLAARRRDLEAIEQLAVEKGASEGEAERAKVRVRASENDGAEPRDEKLKTLRKRSPGKGKDPTSEWVIDLIDERAEEQEAQTEVDLDLEDLTEAISSDAFVVATSPSLDLRPQESRSLDRPASLPPPAPSHDVSDTLSITSETGTESSARSAPVSSVPASASNASTIKSSRPRHASLSARIFGSLSGSVILSSSPTSTSPSPSSTTTPPPTTGADSRDPTPVQNGSSTSSIVSQRSGRSGSIRSVSSARSNASRTSDAGSETSRKGAYSDWFGWKGWNGSGKASPAVKGGPTDGDVPDEMDEEENEEEREDQTEQGDVGEREDDARSRQEELTTPVPNRSAPFFDDAAQTLATSPSTPVSRRQRGTSNASSTTSALPEPDPSSPPASLSALSSSSRRTSTTRSTRTSTVTEAASSPSSTLSPPPVSTPDGKRSPPGQTPPDSPTNSRNRSPAPAPPSLATRRAIATPALSTPMTTSTLSHPSLSSPRKTGHGHSPRGSQTLDPNDVDVFADNQRARPRERDATGETVTEETVYRDRAASLASSATGGRQESAVKVRTERTMSVPPTFVPGVPLYSAPADALASKASDQGYVAAAKGTIGRALGLGASASDGTSAGMVRSSSDGVRRAVNDATFPRIPSLSLSRYSLFSQPALTTPSTSVSLSAGSSPAPAHPAMFSPLPGSSTPTTMELDTISAEAAPPSLALLRPTSTNHVVGQDVEVADDADEGPLIDRYGFIYDVHSGMELLKENRRREEERDKEKKGKGSKSRNGKPGAKKDVDPDTTGVDRSASPSSTEPSGIATPTQLEAHPQLDALREAMGLTPTKEASNAFSPRAEPTALDRDPAPAPPAARPSKLVRAPASDDSSLSRTVGPQSMRALLSQLRTMSDTVEKTQQAEWDAFIRKRQAKLAKLKQQQQLDVAKDAGTNGKAKGRGGKKERPKTIWGAHALAEEKADVAGGPREETWSEDLVGIAQMGTEGKSKKEDWNEFKDLVRKGIPISYRPKIWGECSSANEAREPGVYQELLFSPREDEHQCLKQIDMDCPRTFPTNVFFAGNGPGVAKLHNVLVAYSRRNPKIGYCQGMNNIVATLLLTHPAEEDAFWVLVCIVENILPSDYYTSHLLVSRADQQVLNDLVARLLPNIAAHLEEHSVELSAISFGWFLSLFTDVLPIQTLLRVWDLFFIHGTVLLFRVALGILKLHEAELLACDSAAGLYGLLGALPGHIYHADKLLKVACEDLAASVKDREVTTLRRMHVAALQAELGIASA
ncbi:hypothetical protein JCM10212_001101 [Sporobolomyces blumeae]